MHTPRNYSSPSDRQLCQIYLLTFRGEKWEREIQEHSEGWCWFYYFYVFQCDACMRMCVVYVSMCAHMCAVYR